MRFLDLDLDFFSYGNTCRNGDSGSRPGPGNKSWTISRVEQFLEERCGLSPDTPVPGRTIETHDGVLDFWRTLIKSGSLKIPFEVIHVDAHPDLWVWTGLELTAEFLHFNLKRGLATLKRKQIHAGNYLTFALTYGWINSLIWISPGKYLTDQLKYDADARLSTRHLEAEKSESSSARDISVLKSECRIHFETLPWKQFRTSETFNFIALSKSPAFTPPGSDRLISVIEKYMAQI